MATVLYGNVHQNYSGHSSVRVFAFGTPGDVVEVTSLSGLDLSATIEPTGSVSIEIPLSHAMSGTGINSLGLKIQSEGDISAYISNRATYTTDLTVLFEEASLGQRYVLASMGDVYEDGGQFSAQALVDGTVVTINLSDGRSANVTLNAGETFKFSTNDARANDVLGLSVLSEFDLTGTLITSTAPIAVFSGHSCTRVGSGACDHIVEQMPAIEHLSVDYVVAETGSASGYGENLVRVIASSDDTVVSVGGTEVATLNLGEFYEFVLSDGIEQIQTSQPVLVAQYLQGIHTAGEGDPSMAFVPGTDTWLQSYVVATPSGSDALAQNLINLVVPTAAKDSVVINGVSVDPAVFADDPATGLSDANIPVTPGIVRVEASESFQLSLFGYDSYESFLTFGGANFASGLSNVPPEAADDAFTVDERQTFSGNLFLDNDFGPDRDRDSDPLTITAINGVAINVGETLALSNGATVQVQANGDFAFAASLTEDLADGEEVPVSFTYTLSDGTVTDEATVTVTVQGVDADPEANSDDFETDENVPLTMTIAQLTANDTDPDGDLAPETLSLISSKSGVAEVVGNDVVFTPEPGFFGTASFIYQVQDTAGNADTATVLITVNEVPQVTTFGIDLPENGALAPAEIGSARLFFDGGDPDPTASPDGTVLFAVTADGGLVADPLTGVFSQATFVLAKIATDGSFEDLALDVQGAAGPNSRLTTYAQLATPTAETDIAARLTALQPAFVDEDVVARIQTNLDAQLGGTVSSLTSALSNFAAQFTSLGLNADSATAALAYAVEAAGDFGSLQERGTDGSLGTGWASLADISLDIDGTSVQMRGLADLGALRALSLESVALYTVSNSIGRSVTLSGDVVAFGAPTRPKFEQTIDGSFAAQSAFDGDLIKTHDGYTLQASDGTALLFDDSGLFLRMVMPDGLAIVATHDDDGNIAELSGPNGARLSFERDADGKVLVVRNAEGVNISFFQNADGHLESVTRPSGVSFFEYNAEGDLSSATAPGVIESQFTYDSFGRLATADYGRGAQTEAFSYGEGSKVTITDGANRTTEGDLLPGSTLGRVTDGLGGTSSIVFDDEGAVSGIRAPDGTETQFAFDDQNRLTQITDANGAVLQFGYDGEEEAPSAFTDAGGNTRSFEYDDGGRITEATWPDGSTLTFAYDENGNLTGYANRRGEDVTYTYDARGRLLSESDSSAGPTTYVYDDLGRLISATNDHGTTELAYDSAHRIVGVHYPNGKSLLYSYNEAGLRASMSDGENFGIFYQYDSLGRLEGIRDEDSQIVTYEYDLAGNLVRETNGNGTVSTFHYDDAGRLATIVNFTPDGTVNSFNDYAYDSAGQRISDQTQDGTWTFGYDAIGQLISANFVSINPEIADKSLTYEYDAAGNRTRVVEDGVETLYTANALNQYTQVGDASFTYDADGNMTSRTDGDGTTTYTYDLDNRLASVTEADGTLLAFEYDLFGNRVAKTVDGVETEYLVDPFGMGDVVSEFTDGSLSATYTHGLGLVGGQIDGVDIYYDANAVGTVTTTTDTIGNIQNRYAFTPFGTEMFEVEAVANDFEFNGVLGVSEDSEDLTFYRARSTSASTERFISEEPRFLTGDIENYYRFAANNPVGTFDPDGEIVVSLGISVSGFFGIGAGSGAGIFIDFGRLDAGAYVSAEGGIGGGYSGSIQGGIYKDRGAFEGTSVSAGAGLGAYVGGGIVGTLEPGRLGEFAGVVGEVGFGGGINATIGNTQAGSLRELFDSHDEPKSDRTNLASSEGDGRSDGDPHLVTFDGTGYSFQAAGEFTLVKGDGFEIQTRQEAINDTVSVNTATVMNIGDNVVGIYAKEAIPLVINGTAVVLEKEQSIAVGDGTVHRGTFGRGGDLGEFDVYIVTDGNGNGFWTNVYFGANHLRPFVNTENVAGLLGNLNGDRSDDFQMRDGTVVPQPVAETVLYGEFADSWRIAQEDSLFLYADGESTDTFTDRSFPGHIIRLEDLDPEVRAAAEAVALANGLTPGTFEFETTVLDIALTGSEDFAIGVGGAPDLHAEGEEVEIVEVEINEAPTAVTDRAAVDEDASIDIDVLANDTDPEDDVLTLLSAAALGTGTVSIVDGHLRYVPAADFFGESQLRYDITDSAGNLITGEVIVTVAPQPDDPAAADDVGDGYRTDEETPFTTANVLLNDTDVDGDTLHILSLNAAGTLGLVTDNGDGTFDYDPNGAFDQLTTGETAIDSFSYTVSDGTGRTSIATVEIMIDGVTIDRTGTPGADAMIANGGDDTLRGIDGDDTLIGMAGNDLLEGGLGDDTLQGGSGDDTLDGGPGIDSYDGGDGNDVFLVDGTILSEHNFDGGDGTDTMRLTNHTSFSGLSLGESSSIEVLDVNGFELRGSSDPDRFDLSDVSTILGLDVSTAIALADGNDTFVGSSGADHVDGGLGSDVLRGEDGNDTLLGGNGSDVLDGGAGDDSIIGGATDGDRSDTVYGGDGNDTIRASAGNDFVFGQDGDDIIAGGAGVDELFGQDGDDVITGSSFSDLVFGGDGDDFVNGGFGHDRINGGFGADKFYHAGVEGHGSDWLQDFSSADGDVLLFGDAGATAADFQVNFTHTSSPGGERAGDDNIKEGFVIYKPTGQILWALVDGGGQDEINLQIGADLFDLLL